MNDVPFDRANIYRIRGWQGTVPLPPRRKKPPPDGWTGHGAPYPTDDDLRGFRNNPDIQIGNLALRMPPDVVGIDVDAYASKTGGQTLAAREAEWGQLPATYVSTSRDDGVSGIRFYRVPPRLKWPSGVGPGIEMIHAGHRYAVVWPSLHDETGLMYRWYTPDGRVAAVPPRVIDLPELPNTWVVGLTGGVTQESRPYVPAAGTQAVRDYIDRAPGGPPCRYVLRLTGEIIIDLTTDGACRHDSVSNGHMLTLVRSADWGHHGVPTAVRAVRAVFLAMTPDRAPDEAAGEFMRSVAGAVAKAQANPTPVEEKGCCGASLPRQRAGRAT